MTTRIKAAKSEHNKLERHVLTTRDTVSQSYNDNEQRRETATVWQSVSIEIVFDIVPFVHAAGLMLAKKPQ
jgi:hypothetical protein